jgi:hypothetical protein
VAQKKTRPPLLSSKNEKLSSSGKAAFFRFGLRLSGALGGYSPRGVVL